MDQPLNGKRILFFAPRFFGYAQEIFTYLQSCGAQVDMLPDRPFDSPLMTAITRFGKPLVMTAATRLYRQMLSNYGASKYEIVLVINGQTLSTKFLQEVRNAFPSALFVLYMWDSIHNQKSALQKLALFDRCISFDKNDAHTYKMHFRPLFFSSGFEHPPTDSFDYHLSFIGTAHSDRYRIISKITASLESSIVCYLYLFLQAPWVFYAYKATNKGFWSAKFEQFRFQPLAKKQVQDVFLKSKCILDIEHPRQTGLTMRSLETLGASKKLITTNRDICEYDFFDKNNICVINRNTPSVTKAFLETPYHPIEPSLYDQYKLSSWVKEVIFTD